MRIRSLIFFFVICCFWLAPNATHAQTTPGLEGPDYILRLSLVHLLDPYTPGPHLSFEHRIKGNDYLRHEVGWITDFGYDADENLEHVQGFRVRTGYRRYISNPGKISRRLFREFSFDYRSLDIGARDNFQLGQLNAFDQVRSYEIKQQSFSLNYIRGLSLILGEKDRWQLDLGLGLGLRINHREFSEIPEGVLPDPLNGSLLFSTAVWEYGRRKGLTAGISMPLIGAVGYQF